MLLKAKTLEEKTLIKKLEKAQQLFEKALGKGGAKYIASRVDSEGETQYNRKGFVNGTFPTYREGKGTQANELATRWAHRADVQAGDRTAISFNGSWYLIEKFDSSDLGYQIVAKLTQRQYQSYKEERTNGVGKGQSIQKGVSSITSIHRRASSSNGGVVSDNSVSPRNGRGNSEVQRVGQEQSQRGETASNRNGDSKGGSSSKQGVKYSLKIGDNTITGTIEEANKLVALHNLTEDKLLKVLQLGGFPMPSISITRADMAHDQFGDITVIFGKDTIDPQRNTANRVFSRDGYTPTVPRVDYKVNEAAEERIHKKYYELVRKYG